MRAQIPIGSAHQERLESAFGVVAEIPKTRFNGRSGSSGAGFDLANCRRAELEIISGKVARDHVHVFVGYRPNQDVSQIMQWLKGISSRVLLQEFPHLRKIFWGRHFWARDIWQSAQETSLITLSTLVILPRFFSSAFR